MTMSADLAYLAPVVNVFVSCDSLGYVLLLTIFVGVVC